MRSGPHFILFIAAVGSSLASADGQVFHLTGHYSDRRLANYGRLTLPRVFLYDSHNKLVPDERWPAELAGVRKQKGDAYCCVSESRDPNPGSEPPKNCKRIVYGTNVAADFKDLMNATEDAIRIGDLPAHKWMLVEYAAAWCPPCVIEGKALHKFFTAAKDGSDYVWVTVDMTRITAVQAANRK